MCAESVAELRGRVLASGRAGEVLAGARDSVSSTGGGVLGPVRPAS